MKNDSCRKIRLCLVQEVVYQFVLRLLSGSRQRILEVRNHKSEDDRTENEGYRVIVARVPHYCINFTLKVALLFWFFLVLRLLPRGKLSS